MNSKSIAKYYLTDILFIICLNKMKNKPDILEYSEKKCFIYSSLVNLR